MKKCPTCQSTFDDNMRFCQADGTPLVEDAPAFDPYATIVNPVVSVPEAAPAEPAAEASSAEPESAPAEEPAYDPAQHQTVGSLPIAPPEDVLDLPSSDPLKTMYVSETEMQEALGAVPEPDIVELPPLEETPAPAPPSFIAPEVAAPEPVEAAPAFSSVSEPEPVAEEPVSMPEPEPEPAQFDEAATIIQPTFEPPPAPSFAPPPSPFESSAPAPFEPSAPAAFEPPPPAPVAEWTPPPAPDASWQNQEIGSNTPFQPPPPGVAGQNKTLAIISLVTGILSLICCSWFIPGIAAIVMGFIARGKANSDPQNYGGAGLALGGIITGGISVVLGVIVIILYLAGALAGSLGNF